MIRLLEGLPENVLGVEAIGKVTDDDYEQVLVPAVRKHRDAHVDGWTMGAMWDDARLGLGEVRSWERIAVVTDKDWLQHMVKAFGWMIPGEVRSFGVDELDTAKEWAAS
jgi:hypothetical protein